MEGSGTTRGVRRFSTTPGCYVTEWPVAGVGVREELFPYFWAVAGGGVTILERPAAAGSLGKISGR